MHHSKLIEPLFEQLVTLNQQIITAPLLKKAAVGIKMGTVSMRLTRHALDAMADFEKRIHKLEHGK